MFLGVETVENLCQYLPQERIGEFSTMSATAMLLETEKAIGDGTLYNKHQELIRLYSDFAKDDNVRAVTEPCCCVLWDDMPRGVVAQGARTGRLADECQPSRRDAVTERLHTPFVQTIHNLEVNRDRYRLELDSLSGAVEKVRVRDLALNAARVMSQKIPFLKLSAYKEDIKAADAACQAATEKLEVSRK